MTDPDLLFTAKIRNLTENELVVFLAQRKISGGLKKKYLSLQHGFDT